MYNGYTISLGLMASLLWVFILYKERDDLLGIFSPISLVSIGILAFYIVPSLYWQVVPWRSIFPPYYGGILLVMIAATVFSIPFFIRAALSKKRGDKHLQPHNIQEKIKLNKWSYLGVAFIVIGFMWRIYLISIGRQSRLDREMATFMGSKDLAYLLGNIIYVYPAFYAILILFGNKFKQKIGFALLMSDGLLQMFTLHRYEILTYTLRAMIIVRLKYNRFNKKIMAAAIVFIILIIAILGQVGPYASQIAWNKRYLNASDIVELVSSYEWRQRSVDSGLLSRVEIMSSQVMKRLYDARSASAVMSSVPQRIDYMYGDTFIDVLFALVPRYIWKDKPDLSRTHLITKTVMPLDSGVNPLGTLAELYVNLNFLGVFLGAIGFLFICLLFNFILYRSSRVGLATTACYPILFVWFVGINFNLSQIITELIRGALIIIMTVLYLKIASKNIEE
ncbi:MAG: hypothetical protein KQH53_11655 [Desulfarculaceae bacterium]|nr:hypothetical protein [Desulfarculaceae bacterium]